ncbi:unnamed protein product [Rotaria magnacalcarata]|uniref:Peptidase S1 domain-containing protein n=1 Tax=Rotaria magnacalcarata TaxID=392030 RepID=A0A819RYR0_9BILA|nr:unnamed protein product [Rotaria magnacalcarata]CAF4067170.1 unnamed protein product [Rotaria magnacalcarata]
MNNQIPNISHSSVLSEYCSKKRRCIVFILIIFTNLLVTTVLLVALASIKPCFFMKCHSKASECINRSLFRGQCICDSSTAGNGRTVCDGCGITYIRRDARIIGGVDAIEYSWPFAVLIRQHYKTMLTLNDRSHLVSASWMCGGTLINHKTILTATLEVSIGLYDRRKTSQRRIAKVLQVILHPYYNERHLLNDIAILKLEDYLRPSPTIQFACLPYFLPEVNTTGIAVGFGDTVPGANQGSSILKQTHLTIYPNEFCNHVSPSTKKNWNTQLCCGDLNGERDTCQGDSGGGLYTQRNVSNILHYSVDGIVSYGERCASPMKPGIYTRVSNYIDWIQENSDFDTIDS